jgi:S1/P1 Nuclease
LAWGALGHEVIRELAFRDFNETTRQRVLALLRQDPEVTTFRASSNWPDRPRQCATEHFVNLPRHATGLDADECPLAEECVVSAIEDDFAVLASLDATDEEKLPTVHPILKPPPDGTLLEALARAWRWQRILDEASYAYVSEIGDAENISKSYVSRILRLALLARDIIETVLQKGSDQTLMLERLERPLPASWVEQRARLAVNVVSPKATRVLRASH